MIGKARLRRWQPRAKTEDQGDSIVCPPAAQPLRRAVSGPDRHSVIPPPPEGQAIEPKTARRRLLHGSWRDDRLSWT
jgi:hypothetical protein